MAGAVMTWQMAVEAVFVAVVDVQRSLPRIEAAVPGVARRQHAIHHVHAAAGVGRNGVSDVEVGGRAGRQRGHNFHGVGPGLIAEHGDVRQGEVASVRHRDAINQRTAGQYRGDRTKRRDRNLRRSQDGTGRTVSTGDGETAGARSAGNQRVSHGTIRRRRVTVGESDPHAGGQRRPCEHLRIGNRLIVDDDDVCQGHVAGVADAA